MMARNGVGRCTYKIDQISLNEIVIKEFGTIKRIAGIEVGAAAVEVLANLVCLQAAASVVEKESVVKVPCNGSGIVDILGPDERFVVDFDHDGFVPGKSPNQCRSFVAKDPAQVLAQAKAKDAIEKRDAAKAAEVVANVAKEKETAANKEAQAAPGDPAKQKAATEATMDADDAQKRARAKAAEAAAAQAKLAADNPTIFVPAAIAGISFPAAITGISPTAVTAANTTIKLTVTPIRLGSVPANDLKVFIGAQEVSVTAVTNASGDTWEVTFIAPAPSPTPPGLSAGASYDVSLLVGQNKYRVGNNSGKKLQY